MSCMAAYVYLFPNNKDHGTCKSVRNLKNEYGCVQLQPSTNILEIMSHATTVQPFFYLMEVQSSFQICPKFLTRSNPWAATSNTLYNLHPLALLLSSCYRKTRKQDGLETSKNRKNTQAKRDTAKKLILCKTGSYGSNWTKENFCEFLAHYSIR